VDLRADDQSDPENYPDVQRHPIARMTWMTLRTIPPIVFSALRA
jgi:hypothetical protein